MDTYYHGASNNKRRIIEEEVQKLYDNTKEALGWMYVDNEIATDQSTLEKVMSCNLNQDIKCIS